MIDPMKRREFKHEGLRFSYLDNGGSGKIVIALHAHLMDASTFEPMARALEPAWRVISLDQRGHGFSDHAPSYTREDYLGDIHALLDHVGATTSVVLLGNSLGGVNAYQFAARYPERVRGLIVEDIGAEVNEDMSFVRSWAGTFATRAELIAKIGPRLAPYFESSIRRTSEGWRLAFEPSEMMISQQNLSGDHWDDWLASYCPALLIRGHDSRLTNAAHFEEMARRRYQTQLETLKGGHAVHIDNPLVFHERVRAFLSTLK